jgi:hypothetical protein
VVVAGAWLSIGVSWNGWTIDGGTESVCVIYTVPHARKRVIRKFEDLLTADEFEDRLAAGFDREEDMESLRELDEGDCLSQDILKAIS